MSLSSFASQLGLEAGACGSAGSHGLGEQEDEQTMIVATPVALVFGASSEAGEGTLYITTRRVIWASASQPGLSLAMTYQQVVMHAISRDTSAFPRPCIYLQLDNGSEEMQEASEDEDGGEGQADAEIRLIPEDPAKVDDIFKALCECAALNPDPEAEGEGDFYFDEDEVLGGLDQEARADLLARQAAGMELEEGKAELGELVGEDPGRFEDDEEEEEEEEQATDGH